MAKTVNIDEVNYEVPDSFDSTKQGVRLVDGKIEIYQKESNNVVSTVEAKRVQGNTTGADASSQKVQVANSKTETQTLSDKDTLKGSGLYMNQLYAMVDEDEQDIITTNAGKYKISIFFTPKFMTKDSIFTKEQAIFLKYNDTVKGLVMEDDLDRIGMKGYIDVINKGSFLDVFLGRHNNYYLVVNITKYADSGSFFAPEKPVLKFQPYIFDIDYVQNLSSAEKEQKLLRIGITDIITGILKTHSIASVIKFSDKKITKLGSYKEVFEVILDYVKNYIKVNTNNKYEFKKDLLFDAGTKCLGNSYNGYDMGAGMESLVQASFSKINKNASILEAMQILLRDCCTTLKTPKSFSDSYMTIGDVLIPFFFKEEYPDPQFLYSSLWVKQQKDSSTATTGTASKPPATPTTPTKNPQNTRPAEQGVADQSAQSAPAQTSTTSTSPTAEWWDNTVDWISTSKAGEAYKDAAKSFQQTTQAGYNKLDSWSKALKEEFPNAFKTKNVGAQFYGSCYSGKSPNLICRQMTMRDIFMPFFLAFGHKKYSGLMEDINPDKDNMQTNEAIPLLGVYQGDIKSFKFNPIDLKTVSKLWKNVVFLDCSDKATCSNSTLIFFSWFFDFFQRVFLNHDERGLVPNVMPDFFMLSRVEGIKHATKEANKFENKFDEYNSYTYATETQDSVKECLRVMGKNIASFALANDAYTFTLNGNLFRRPNEIVRIGFKGNQGGWQQFLSFNTGLTLGDYNYLYIKRVTHRFIGNSYNTDVVGCKLCEIFETRDSNQ